ncbi:MAG: hypothetical protein ABSD47_04450 [Candidatus Methylomirabilota bacterium]
MTRQNLWRVWWGAVLFLLAVMALGQAAGRSAASSTPIDEKTIALKPSVTFVKASFLTGELQALRVAERVEHRTGKTMGAPVFRATLTVTNDSENQAARLLGGKIEYIDPEGKLIPIAHTTFPFIGVPTDRLDPGMHTSQVIEVPFPAAALKPNAIREVRLELTYLPIPYREDTVSIPVYLGS